MNNRGQVLVFFVILIPLLVTIAIFTIDIGYNFYQSNKLNNLNKMVIEYGLKHLDNKNLKNKLIDLIYKNDSSIDEYNLEIEKNTITLSIKKSNNSIFGKSLNINFYYIYSKYTGYIRNDKIVIEKG